MKRDSRRQTLIFCVIGIIPVIWLALLVAPSVSGGLLEIIEGFPAAIDKPFNIEWCGDSLKTVLIFIAAYAMGIGIYFSTRRNMRPREEHGSAKWGEATSVNRRLADRHYAENRILTQNVRLGLDSRKHRLNLNVLVVGGSGSGKTRYYAKPNAMQMNTSMIILDPKGEITRDTGHLFKSSGIEVFAAAPFASEFVA